MFNRLIGWIREVWHKMIGKTDLKGALSVDVAMSSVMTEALQKWCLMYANQSPWITDDVKSLNLAAGISSEIATMVTIEMKVMLSDGPRAIFLSKQLEKVLSALRENVEYGIAKGGLVIKPYPSGDEIVVDYVQADEFYPVSFDSSKRMTACIFSDKRTVGNAFYTRLEYHKMTADGCVIVNKVFRSDSANQLGSEVPLSAIEDWAELLPEAIITGVTQPLYAYFRYPKANNIDPTSPLGVSCFSRAVNLIEEADIRWSQLSWEFKSGERAIYADPTALSTGTDGKQKLPETGKRLYRTIEPTGPIGTELWHDWTPEFRNASIESGLDAILKKIEFTCGLAYGTLSDPEAVAKTATEIVTSRQRTYSTVVDTQKSLQSALEQLLYAMNVWANVNKLAPKGEYTATYTFDDSVVVDKDAQFQQDLRVLDRIMGAVEFRMRNMKEDEATARKWIDMMNADRPKVDMFNAEAQQ